MVACDGQNLLSTWAGINDDSTIKYGETKPGKSNYRGYLEVGAFPSHVGLNNKQGDKHLLFPNIEPFKLAEIPFLIKKTDISKYSNFQIRRRSKTHYVSNVPENIMKKSFVHFNN